MVKKRVRIMICVVSLPIILYSACSSFAKWINEPMYPQVPSTSSPGKIVLASKGCCFLVTDATVSLADEYGNETVVISQDTVCEFDIFESTDIPDISTPVRVTIDFTGHYDIEEDVSILVGEFSSTDEILKNGLLLRFGDGSLEVYTCNEKKVFKSAVFGSGDAGWFQET